MAVTANVLERTMKLECLDTLKQGTAFTIDHSDRQWLVTASHLLPNGESEPTLKISFRNQRIETRLRRLAPVRSEADVAVFDLPEPLTPPNLPLPTTSSGIVMGQDAFYTGYPNGMAMRGFAADDEFPLVKRAAVSAWIRDDDGYTMLLLDGFVNEGFSGGPAVASVEPGAPQNLQVVGIISGFMPEQVEQDEGWTVRANSGIIAVVDIRHAVEVIERHLAAG